MAVLLSTLLLLFTLLRYQSKPKARDNVFSKKLRDNEYSIYSLSSTAEGTSPARLSAEQEREQLYEAYNLLHTLAQDFHKPFDSPAVIVVGHQTSGKSALIEAIMGFQYNQVGGGTKTRRPIALRMQYNPNCVQPLCFLTLDNGKEEQRSLQDIQAYIESENKRLEMDPSRSFDPREINIRMEYKYCPNMIMIDTPGMIQPPRGRRTDLRERQTQLQAREAEQLVLSKIRCQDYIILCVEDTIDWKHATTRNVVGMADPTFSRTVLVSTKLDTKLPQLSSAEDVNDFLNPPQIANSYHDLMGGPFHTSVPSGRVGVNLQDNEDFVAGIRNAESKDRNTIMNAFKTSTTPLSVNVMDAMNNVGVSRLRAFLEAKVEECYRKNVARIVPLLQHELKLTENRIKQIETELESLSSEHLKAAAMAYRDKFIEKLTLVIQGTVQVSAEQFGETLETEHLRGGLFTPPIRENEKSSNNGNGQRSPQEISTIDEEATAAVGAIFGDKQPTSVRGEEVDNAKYRLFGGAQYLRAMKEFNLCVRRLPLPRMTAEDIANAAGMSGEHDGADYMRAACVIAMEKAKESFDPLLTALEYRADYIMKRVYPIVTHLLSNQENLLLNSLSRTMSKQNMPSVSKRGTSYLLNKMKPFQRLLQRIYDRFVEETLQECAMRCRDDLDGMTEFVTFDVDDRGGSSSLYSSMPTPKKVSEIYVLLDQQMKKQEQEKLARKFQPRSQPLPPRVSKKEEYPDILDGYEQEDEDEKAIDEVEDAIAREWNQANGNTKNTNTKSNSKVKSPARSVKPTPVKPATNQQQIVSISPASADSDVEISDFYRVFQLTEEMVKGGSSSRTLALVTAMVQYIISSWRTYFARTTSMKFNSFFLTAFKKRFPNYLREQLDAHYDEEMEALFDMTEARRELQSRLASLWAEREANEKLQQRFEQIEKQFRYHSTAPTASLPGSSSSFDNRGQLGDDSNDEEGQTYIDLDSKQNTDRPMYRGAEAVLRGGGSSGGNGSGNNSDNDYDNNNYMNNKSQRK